MPFRHEQSLPLCLQTTYESKEAEFTVNKAVLAGWTSRDRHTMQKHIDELAEIGLAAPERTPLFFRCACRRLTLADSIEVLGNDTSGEVEFIVLFRDEQIWIGVGSDHTDRAIEAQGISVAKQICERPMARMVWPYEEVKDHWNRLILRSYRFEGTKRMIYQEGEVGQMLDPDELIDQFRCDHGRLHDGTAMFGGTIAAIGGITPSNRFEFELEDPVLRRKLSHAYNIVALPIIG